MLHAMWSFFRVAFAAAGLWAAFILVPTASGAASLKACVKSLERQAVRSGISRELAARALGNVAYDEKAVRFSRTQPEYVTPIWDYMAFLVDNKRITDGKTMLKRHDKTIRAVAKAYGMDRYILTALWGVESDYGKQRGDFHLPHALANIACLTGKRKFARQQLIAALKLVQRGDLKLKHLQGSWAGAFGQTQFLPTTYRRLAVDFDKNGKRDLVNSVPDALASAANFLTSAGWRRGQGWGFEVRLPKNYRGPRGRRGFASYDAWSKRGLRRRSGGKLKGKARAALILPAGRNGPAFLIRRNFNVLRTYNAATPYALAISHLSDRLKGKGPLKTSWPTKDPGLSRAQRLELQKLLLKAGYDIGQADGRIGPITKRAIKQAQKKIGMRPDGRPGTKIYRALGGKTDGK
jgi:lytic murein transglycosylase